MKKEQICIKITKQTYVRNICLVCDAGKVCSIRKEAVCLRKDYIRYGRTGDMKREEWCTELTVYGKRFCVIAGLLEEAAVLGWLDIRISTAPVIVLCFLWFLFALLTGSVLIEADHLRTVWRMAGRRARRMLSAGCRVGQGSI